MSLRCALDRGSGCGLVDLCGACGDLDGQTFVTKITLKILKSQVSFEVIVQETFI